MEERSVHKETHLGEVLVQSDSVMKCIVVNVEQRGVFSHKVDNIYF